MVKSDVPVAEWRGGAAEVTEPASQGLRVTERLFVEKSLLQMYPRLQRHDLLPWAWFNGPLIPDFIVKNTSPHLRRILVIGCGDGVLCNTLSMLFPQIEIIGVDPDSVNITKARATVGYRKNLKFICGNAATMLDIPCDRIIYDHCLTRMKDTVAFRKLVVKTTDWLVEEGDFIVVESPIRLLFSWRLWRQIFQRFKRKRNFEACLQSLLAEIGYSNPMVSHCRRLPWIASETCYRSPKSITLTGMLASHAQEGLSEWQDLGDQSHDSVLGFLFANRQMDLRRELV